MTNNQSSQRPIQFQSRTWVLHQATEEELLEYLNCLLVAQRAQHDEMMALVETVVEEQHLLREEMEQAAMDGWDAEDAPSRTSWLALGAAGLIGYLLGRRD